MFPLRCLALDHGLICLIVKNYHYHVFFCSDMPFKQTNPSKVLLLTLMNDIYSVNCFIIYKVP
jgi:hypothetical protein